MSIKSGDNVWLKSGGPKMTAKEPNEEGEVICNWFLNGELKEDLFNVDQLTTDDPRPPVKFSSM